MAAGLPPTSIVEFSGWKSRRAILKSQVPVWPVLVTVEPQTEPAAHSAIVNFGQP
jgi:hypothetical protein